MHTVALIGTRAQAIKMAPVIIAIRDAGLSCEIVLTGQHRATVDELLSDFGLQPDTRLWRNDEAKRVLAGLGWSIVALWRSWGLLRKRAKDDRTVVLVHGDTATTLIGAVAGRLARCEVAHVEAGLRSGSLLDPFPEEGIRRLVTRLAQTAYCPGPDATSVLASSGCHCVDTEENTVLDAVRYVMQHPRPPDVTAASPAYVVVSAHRMETVMRRRRLRALTDLVGALSQWYTVYFVLHPITLERLRQYGLMERLQAQDKIELTPRMGYAPFIQLASAARAVLTDGGGNQEEMAYLGVPTLLLRNRTERHHGLGYGTHLIGLDTDRALALLKQLPTDRPNALSLEATPSRRIACDIVARTT